MKHMNNSYGNSRIFGHANCKMPLNLQFFAEPGGEGGAGGAGDAGAAGGEGDQGAAGGTEGDQGAGSGTLGFDDFLKDSKNQSEFDKRVAKALETQRSKLQQEFENQKTEAEKLAKMNNDQKAQYQREKKDEDLQKREAEITKRELTATAKEQLAEKGLPLQLAEILNYASADDCAASIEAVGKAFQAAVESAVENRLKGGTPPKKADGTNLTVFTKSQVEAMTPDEINKNWDAIQASMKNFN